VGIDHDVNEEKDKSPSLAGIRGTYTVDPKAIKKKRHLGNGESRQEQSSKGGSRRTAGSIQKPSIGT